MKTYVIGHQKPDLDSVVAAISFAEFRKQRGDTDVTPAMIDSANEETSFVFKKFGLELPQTISLDNITQEDKVILVDHNEESQRLPGLNPDQITRIFDHHKVNLNLNNPIEIFVLPVGSSNTIAWQLFTQNKLAISTDLSKLMLCAILSDTVGLKSSTTTEKDKQAVASLQQTSGISDLEALTLEIFKAKSNISALTDEQIVLNDYKIFEFSGKKVLIGQIETVEQQDLLNGRGQSLLAACNSIKTKEVVDYLFLAVTDILKVNTKLILPGVGETELAIKAFGGTPINSIIDIGPKMSRKKDIAPAIETAIKG